MLSPLPHVPVAATIFLLQLHIEYGLDADRGVDFVVVITERLVFVNRELGRLWWWGEGSDWGMVALSGCIERRLRRASEGWRRDIGLFF